MYDKIVDFSLCNQCIHKDESDELDPCYTCFNHPSREATRVPLRFEKANNGQKIASK